jgi:hypothetical protein
MEQRLSRLLLREQCFEWPLDTIPRPEVDNSSQPSTWTYNARMRSSLRWILPTAQRLAMALSVWSANWKVSFGATAAGSDNTGPITSCLGAQGAGISASSGLLTTNLPLFPGRLQLPVALRVDVLLAPRQHVLRRDVARGAVQADVVVVVHVSAYQTVCIIER